MHFKSDQNNRRKYISNTRRLMALSFLILNAIPTGSLPALAKKHEQSKSQTNDEQVLRRQASDYAAAFSAGNSKALADMWSPEGTFIDADGQEYKGRASIQSRFDNLFKQIGKQPLTVKVSSIRFPAPGVAIEEGTSEIANGAPPLSTGKYTVTHVKTSGNWLMEIATETCEKNPKPGPPENKLPRLNWLLGNWTAGGTRLHVDWLPNHDKTFMMCTFTGAPGNADAARNDDLQIIGWNPRSSQVNVWHYAANGGFGYGRMINTDSQTWIERASSMTPDGTICSADYVFKKIDADSFTWQSIKRSRGSTSLPDLPVVTVQRDTTASK
ncbi:MAG TPA: nuclear transport factor 2 family protein [Drouetiella sp.]|jgi:uncharacterized protein (TIGR02246 family)